MDSYFTDGGIGYVERHAELPSTNTRAAELAAQRELALPALIIAQRQTAGRGRGANRWWANEGALTFSLLLDAAQDSLRAEQWPLVSLATALVVHETIAPHLPSESVELKWPNDVYACGKKICGILVEAPSVRPPRLIVGVGLNVNNALREAPEEIRTRATSMFEESSQRFDLEELLADVVRGILLEVEAIAAGELDLVARWEAHCLLHGRTVTIDQTPGLVTGRCVGISADGALRLQTLSGEQRVYAGVVRGWE